MTTRDPACDVQQALIKATLAIDRLARHEQSCDARWQLVSRLLWVVMTKLMVLLALLLTDKLGWFA